MGVDEHKIVSEYKSYYDKLVEFHGIETEVFQRKIRDYFGKTDYYKFTWDELLSIGFAVWDDDMILIPKYQYECVIDGTILMDIDGSEIIFEEDVTDDDDRYGYLAYGMSRDRLRVVNRENTINDIIDDED